MQETLEKLPYKDLSAFELRPQHFCQHLKEALGFELVAERSVSGAAKGFDRPLLVFQKPERKTQPKPF
jgi:Bicoid-interacting protein 3 (Bin3)